MTSFRSRSPRIAAALVGARGAVAALVPFVIALGGSGCAHMPPPTSPPTAATSPVAAPEPKGAPEPTASSPGRAAMGSSGALDPSEEMSAEELASIPEPLPGGQRSPPSSSQGGAEGTREARSPDDDDSPRGPAVWRVQVLATPDRALADRVAREAGERLGTVADVEFESSLYKVRLGRFDSEEDAGGLRDRAVELGYSGAFRVKKTTPTTDE